MAKQGISIHQAAEKLGVSTRTIRRYIKAGKIKAQLVNGKFGAEYLIKQLPPELLQKETAEEKPSPGQFTPQDAGQSIGQALDIIRDLQQKNLAMAAQLGAATERVRNLENQLKLLTAARIPWWKKLLIKRKTK